MRYLGPAVAAAGFLLVAHYARAWYRAEERAAYMAEQRARTSYDADRFHHELRKGTREALDALRAKTGLSERDRRQIEVVEARLSGDEARLRAFLSPREHEYVWTLAVEQLVELRRGAGPDGPVPVWEAVVDRRLRHPFLDENPFPVAQKWAARELAEHHLERGDGRSAHAWARRLKHDYEADFDAPCGAWVQSDFQATEELLERSAALAGFGYEREEWNDAARSAKLRRMYGPHSWECALGVVAGIELAFLGLRLRRGRRPRPSPRMPFWWQRRGWVARSHLGTYLALLAALLVSVAPKLVGDRTWVAEETWWVVGLGSAAYTLLIVPFLGCFLARTAEAPTADLFP